MKGFTLAFLCSLLFPIISTRPLQRFSAWPVLPHIEGLICDWSDELYGQSSLKLFIIVRLIECLQPRLLTYVDFLSTLLATNPGTWLLACLAIVYGLHFPVENDWKQLLNVDWRLSCALSTKASLSRSHSVLSLMLLASFAFQGFPHGFAHWKDNIQSSTAVYEKQCTHFVIWSVK